MNVNFRTSMDLFEDAAKLRTARKMWHDLLRQRYDVTDERALALRIHIVTAGSYMTYQEPINNIVRRNSTLRSTFTRLRASWPRVKPTRMLTSLSEMATGTTVTA